MSGLPLGKTAGITNPGLPRISNASQARPGLFQPRGEPFSARAPAWSFASSPHASHRSRPARIAMRGSRRQNGRDCATRLRECEGLFSYCGDRVPALKKDPAPNPSPQGGGAKPWHLLQPIHSLPMLHRKQGLLLDIERAETVQQVKPVPLVGRGLGRVFRAPHPLLPSSSAPPGSAKR
jgi:hypothetical protein